MTSISGTSFRGPVRLARPFVAVLLPSALAVALLSGCGEPPPPPAPPAPEVPVVEAPKPKPIELAELAPITLTPGESAEVEVNVVRNDNTGPVQIQVVEPPQGVTAEAVEIPADASSGKLKVVAAESLGDEKLMTTLRVTAKVGEQQSERNLGLTVNKINLPKLASPPPTLLQPGASKTAEVKIDRNGYTGPLELTLENLPAKVTGTVESVAADKSTAKLELNAAGDAQNVTQPARVVVKLYGRTVAADVPIQVDRTPYKVESFKAVSIKPGETKEIKIPIQRNSYTGPLDLNMADLPEGITVSKVQVAANQKEATLTLKAAPDAKERVRSAKVVSTGGVLSSTDPIILRISTEGRGFLPPEFAANPDGSVLLRRGSFGGRLTAESKQALLDAFGGTAESEAAVMRGLKWLAAHQQPNGSWKLKGYGEGIEGCDCVSDAEKEVVDYDTAGTAFGLLPFLGAGVTHNRAPESPPELAQYKSVVEKGLVFLGQSQIASKKESEDGSLGGNMYAHALATIALCEAYGLSGDERLKVPTQRAVMYMMNAQHKEGGWRYGYNQAGDMSATGWVFLAIRSGQLAGLSIKRDPLVRAERFIESCACGPEGAKLTRFCYMPTQEPKPTVTLTAAGMLTRQYLLTPKDDPQLVEGVKYLMQNLPPESGTTLGSIYYYYYGTQVLHHMEGPEFDLWNHRMREHLIRTQQKEGHKTGSWDVVGAPYGPRGGRMYTTAMALMTLECYYRHLPMYRPVKRVAE